MLGLRFKAKHECGVDGGILQFKDTGVGNFLHENSIVKLQDLIRDVEAAQRDVLIVNGVDQEVVVV